jgi:hypothetical protein
VVARSLSSGYTVGDGTERHRTRPYTGIEDAPDGRDHRIMDEPGLWAKSHAAEGGLSTPPIILVMLTSPRSSQTGASRGGFTPAPPGP